LERLDGGDVEAGHKPTETGRGVQTGHERTEKGGAPRPAMSPWRKAAARLVGAATSMAVAPN
jgi:hypothetical protein